jgi:hypothetical protein
MHGLELLVELSIVLYTTHDLHWRYNAVCALASSMRFRTVNFSRMLSLTTRPTPNLEDQELHHVRPLYFYLSGMMALPEVYA